LTHDAPASRSGVPGRRRMYVYYRVDAAQAGAAIAAARRALALLCERHVGLRAELMRRPEGNDGHVTLMEAYARDAAVSPDGIDPALLSDIEAEVAPATAAWMTSARHVEVFDACA
jgi:hypothetical protein